MPNENPAHLVRLELINPFADAWVSQYKADGAAASCSDAK